MPYAEFVAEREWANFDRREEFRSSPFELVE